MTRGMRLPHVTLGLSLLSVLVLVYEYRLPTEEAELFILRWAAVPREITVGDLPPTVPVPIAATLLTSLFLHGSWAHLAGNLVYLWVFGPAAERAVGSSRFVVVYLGCGVVAGVVQVVAYPTSMIPMIGASGALAGVMSACLVLEHALNARTIVFGGWCTLQLVQGLNAMDGSQQWTGGVAAWAHLGGVLAGVILAALARTRRTGVHVLGASSRTPMGNGTLGSEQVVPP